MLPEHLTRIPTVHKQSNRLLETSITLGKPPRPTHELRHKTSQLSVVRFNRISLRLPRPYQMTTPTVVHLPVTSIPIRAKLERVRHSVDQFLTAVHSATSDQPMKQRVLRSTAVIR
jgi:hypothetical protein